MIMKRTAGTSVLRCLDFLIWRQKLMNLDGIKKGYVMVFAAGLIWGTIGLFSTLLSGYGMAPPAVAFLRMFCALIFLVPFMLITRGASAFVINRRGLIYSVLLGIFAQGLFNTAYTEAINESGMAAAAVLLYTSPIFASLLSRIFFKERISLLKAAALCINVTGCALAVTGGSFNPESISVIGLAAGIAAGFLYSLLTILGKAASEECDSLTVLFYGLLAASVFLALISKPWIVIPQCADTRMILYALGYGLIPTCAPLIIYMKGLSKGLEASRVPVIASVETVAAAVTGMIAFHQIIGPVKIAGIIIVMFSIFLMNAAPGEDKAENQQYLHNTD